MGQMCLTVGGAESAIRLAGGVGRLLFRLDQTHRQRAIDHLAIAFPEMSAEQRYRLARRSFENLGKLLVEVCHSPRLFHSSGWTSRIGLGEVTQAVQVLNSGKPAITVTGHLGNWEVLGNALAMMGYPIHAVARPIDNRLINQWLLDIRQKRGMRILTKWDATDDLVGLLRSGNVLGFLADQSAGSRGTFVPFFGKLASAHKSIALLALTQEAPVICGYARRLGTDFRFELGVVDVIRPDQWADKRNPVYYITARYVRAIETMVRRWPEQYLWMHRRWRRRPAWEIRRKPMPRRLRRDIEELPWVDQTTMEQLVCPPEPQVAGGKTARR